jgi:glycylpeptide N-tetradecanoyltransferase
MPAGFEWCSMDVNEESQLQEIYNLLTVNYVEDDDCNFRFVMSHITALIVLSVTA